MGKSAQEGDDIDELMADDPTVELDMLEETMTIEGAKELRHDAHGLSTAAIPSNWILQGNPVARDKRLAGSSDQLASAHMWDCTAGRFEWSYDHDEVVHVLEGSAVIEDAAGAQRTLQSGDTFLFPAGSRYQWHVANYVRKVVFVYSPLSREVRLIKRLLERLTSPFRRKPATAAAAARPG